MILYYITDRRQFPDNDAEQRRRVLDKIAEAVRCGVDYIQLREKDLSPRELEFLAHQAVRVVREGNKLETRNVKVETRLLVNSRSDIAIAAGADGVHLRSDDVAASEARVIFSKAGVVAPVIAVSCHTAAEVRMAESHGADFAVFAPVFGKAGEAGSGTAALRAACQPDGRPVNVEGVGSSGMPVLALGGVTLENAAECRRAGAAGVAGIRLFQENDVGEVVRRLRVSGF